MLHFNCSNSIRSLLIFSVLISFTIPVFADRDWQNRGHGYRERSVDSDRAGNREFNPRRERFQNENSRQSRNVAPRQEGNERKPRPIGKAYSDRRESEQTFRRKPHDGTPQNRPPLRSEKHYRDRVEESRGDKKPAGQHRPSRQDDKHIIVSPGHQRESGRADSRRDHDRVDSRRDHVKGDSRRDHDRNGDRHDKKFHYQPRSQVNYRHSYHGKPKYRLHHRHHYVYYRSPWYSTRYLAPIRIHYHPVGYHLHTLPHNSVRIFVNSLPFFYLGGIFYSEFDSGYIVVSAPIGAIVSELPVGFIAFNNGFDTYFYANATYYRWSDSDAAFVVVSKPQGADEAIEKATSERLYAYPNAGQSEEQQAKDRYECHQWAVSESHVDPTLEDENEELALQDVMNYRRALTACLEGRDYTVK